MAKTRDSAPQMGIAIRALLTTATEAIVEVISTSPVSAFVDPATAERVAARMEIDEEDLSRASAFAMGALVGSDPSEVTDFIDRIRESKIITVEEAQSALGKLLDIRSKCLTAIETFSEFSHQIRAMEFLGKTVMDLSGEIFEVRLPFKPETKLAAAKIMFDVRNDSENREWELFLSEGQLRYMIKSLQTIVDQLANRKNDWGQQ